MSAPVSVEQPSSGVGPVDTLPAIASRAAGSRTAGRLPAAVSFWVLALVFAIAMAFSTIPTPLYASYQQRDGFSTFMITVVFAAYSIGVIGSLFLAGHISDWFGRRPLLLAALVTESAAALIFVAWTALPGLILARVVTGIGVGLVTATATAQMGELNSIARPNTGRTRAERAAVAANMGGLALGPLIAGLLAQFVVHPLVVPYLLFLVLLIIAVIAVLVVPETVELTNPRPSYRPQRVSVPAQGRPLYYTMAIAAFASFSILGLFTSVAPGFIAGTLEHSSPLLAGTVTFLVFGSAAVAQIAASGLPAARQVKLGLALMAVGILIVTTAVWWPTLALFIVGGVIAGSGVGVLFKGALATAAGLALPQARGETLAGVFLAAYAGLVVPVLGIGLATLEFPLRSVLLGFAAGVLLVIAAVSTKIRRSCAGQVRA
ncbi:MAG TPA: MFS transporter [Kineosporiaceae bacterium]|nr:MFS transporter [Kineosporiaceae bacterium]